MAFSPNNSSGGGEVSIFWGGLVLAPALWAVLFLVALSRFNFQWIILVIIALSLTSSNLFGYVRYVRVFLLHALIPNVTHTHVPISKR